jgi:hypothetical protein
MAAETPEPTLDDLLTACDAAEEAGVPPMVVDHLRLIVRTRDHVEQEAIDNGISIELGRRISEQINGLDAAFRSGGTCHGVLSPGADLIDDGIPSLIAEVAHLRDELARYHEQFGGIGYPSRANVERTSRGEERLRPGLFNAIRNAIHDVKAAGDAPVRIEFDRRFARRMADSFRDTLPRSCKSWDRDQHLRNIESGYEQFFGVPVAVVDGRQDAPAVVGSGGLVVPIDYLDFTCT